MMLRPSELTFVWGLGESKEGGDEKMGGKRLVSALGVSLGA